MVPVIASALQEYRQSGVVDLRGGMIDVAKRVVVELYRARGASIPEDVADFPHYLVPSAVISKVLYFFSNIEISAVPDLRDRLATPAAVMFSRVQLHFLLNFNTNNHKSALPADDRVHFNRTTRQLVPFTDWLQIVCCDWMYGHEAIWGMNQWVIPNIVFEIVDRYVGGTACVIDQTEFWKEQSTRRSVSDSQHGHHSLRDLKGNAMNRYTLRQRTTKSKGHRGSNIPDPQVLCGYTEGIGFFVAGNFSVENAPESHLLNTLTDQVDVPGASIVQTDVPSLPTIVSLLAVAGIPLDKVDELLTRHVVGSDGVDVRSGCVSLGVIKNAGGSMIGIGNMRRLPIRTGLHQNMEIYRGENRQYSADTFIGHGRMPVSSRPSWVYRYSVEAKNIHGDGPSLALMKRALTLEKSGGLVQSSVHQRLGFLDLCDPAMIVGINFHPEESVRFDHHPDYHGDSAAEIAENFTTFVPMEGAPGPKDSKNQPSGLYPNVFATASVFCKKCFLHFPGPNALLQHQSVNCDLDRAAGVGAVFGGHGVVVTPPPSPPQSPVALKYTDTGTPRTPSTASSSSSENKDDGDEDMDDVERERMFLRNRIRFGVMEGAHRIKIERSKYETIEERNRGLLMQQGLVLAEMSDAEADSVMGDVVIQRQLLEDIQGPDDVDHKMSESVDHKMSEDMPGPDDMDHKMSEAVDGVVEPVEKVDVDMQCGIEADIVSANSAVAAQSAAFVEAHFSVYKE